MNSPETQSVLCPYCGTTQPEGDRCADCGGRFDVLSRQATQNAMGPWFIRDPDQPFRPGFSYDTLRKMVRRGRINAQTILRGPTTHQFWMHASEIPGLAHLVGRCHACSEVVAPEDVCCEYCGAPFGPVTVREALGLLPQRDVQTMAPSSNHMPGDADTATDSTLTSVGYERLQAAMAQSTASPASETSHRPTAADLAQAVQLADDDSPIALEGIRPPRQKRNVHDYVDPEELAAQAEQRRQKRLRIMKGAFSIVMVLVVAALLVVMLWKGGVFDLFRATAPGRIEKVQIDELFDDGG